MKKIHKNLNVIAVVLALLILAAVIWSCFHGSDSLHTQVSDGIEQIDLDTI